MTLDSRLCGSGGWVRKFLVSRSFPNVASIQAGGRLFAEAWCGGVKTCPYKAGTRFGRWRPWGRILLFAGITGHFRALGSCLCGSGGWVRKFHVPAHFRSFPSVASIQAGATVRWGPGTEAGLKPTLTWLAHGLADGGPRAGFCFLRA